MRKITIFAVIALAVSLSGCGQVQRAQAHWFGHTKVCVDGVTYIQFPTGTTVQRDRQGNVVPCN
jgi:hypothetical protein